MIDLARILRDEQEKKIQPYSCRISYDFGLHLQQRAFHSVKNSLVIVTDHNIIKQFHTSKILMMASVVTVRVIVLRLCSLLESRVRLRTFNIHRTFQCTIGSGKMKKWKQVLQIITMVLQN